MKNKELLLKAKASILAEPEHFDMTYWMKDKINQKWAFYVDTAAKIDLSECGTAACVAGWIVHHALASKKIRATHRDIDSTARGLLGVKESVSDTLFVVSDWPCDLRKRYEKAKRTTTRARLAAERIDRFIAEQEAASA